MDQRTIQILFALLRSAICGAKLTEQERFDYSPELLQDLLKISSGHDMAHLLVLGLKQNELIPQEHNHIEKCILKAVYRYEGIQYEYENLCAALEKAGIPFLPLKGSVIRKYYPEAWMRTSCDIDVLVHREDLERAITYLVDNYKYVEKERATHDVSLFSPSGINVELHFDLVEEGRAQNAIDVLQSVWKNVTLREDSEYWYEMTDAYFYFYHVAHMAKHFETGGCGIRPFMDLFILDRQDGAKLDERNALLRAGNLLQFAEAARALSRVWFGGEEPDLRSLKLQAFILEGGVYGSINNRVALQQKKRGGKKGYIFSRIFVSYDVLKRYFPVLEKHRWLMPFMQVRRWFMLLRPDVAKRARKELQTSNRLDNKKAKEMQAFLEDLGL